MAITRTHLLIYTPEAGAARQPADERFGIVPIIPTESTWNGRGGRYLCLALAYGLTPVTGDHAALAAGGGT